MAMRARRKRAKRVVYKLIDKFNDQGKQLYRWVTELINDHHEDLKGARIALAWNMAWKPNADGQVTLGKCKKASDLDREFAPYDFVIILRKEFFEEKAVKDEQRLAVLDHELTHADIRRDASGEPMEDERGRKLYRMRKHDIEEFSSVVARHGTYKRDIEHFYACLKEGEQKSLIDEKADKAEGEKRAPKAAKKAQA
jgi:hypothetical protein